MTNIRVSPVLVSLACGVVGFAVGVHYAGLRHDAAMLKTERQVISVERKKSRAALAAGIRTEQAQDKTNAYFDQLQATYENDKKTDPTIGCVLDPVSLRRWNAANEQPDEALREPDDELPGDVAAIEGGGRRGE